MQRTRPWELTDALWERIAPLIPPRPAHPKGGRPANDDRQMMGAILYVLRTGIQWNALPREQGASTTVYDRYRLWMEQGVFARMWEAGLQEFDDVVGIDWEWQSLDGAMTKAPFGGAATGANPTDRGKKGTKRSTLSEGHGVPLSIAVAGANVHDTQLVAATLDDVAIARPAPTKETPHHLCLDAAYVGDKTATVVQEHLMCAHAGRTRPMPAAWIRPRHHAAGWWSAYIPGSIAPADCWFVGRSELIPTRHFSS